MSRTYRKKHYMSWSKHSLSNDMVPDGTINHPSNSCTNHGGCPYCLSDRTHRHKKADMESLQESMTDSEGYLSYVDDVSSLGE